MVQARRKKMANQSRDTYVLTNIMHQLLNKTPIIHPRHYVGVRMQQGVPLVDADWNELEDIRRMELILFLKYFFGNGVPISDSGFKITESAEENNFSIGPGIILAEGKFVINEKLTTYKTQPHDPPVPPLLATPPSNSTDIVYLDTWEKETDSGVAGDVRIMDDRIGIETCQRIERLWKVRVKTGAGDLSTITNEPGHVYIPLSLLNREAQNARVGVNMIVDLRKTGLTVAEHLKIPLYVERLGDILDYARFSAMLKNLKTILFAMITTDTLPYELNQPDDKELLFFALQQLLNLTQTGMVQSSFKNMNNADGLLFMNNLYDEQTSFLTILEDKGNKNNTAAAFIEKYRKYLDGNVNEYIKGLKLALTNHDLLEAVKAQELINIKLSETGDILPEGAVYIQYMEVFPYEKMKYNKPYTFTFDIESHVLNLPPGESEEFEVKVTMNPPSWQATLDKTTLTLVNNGGKDTVIVTVTPNSQDNMSHLLLEAYASRNQLLKSTQPALPLSYDEFPPAPKFLIYAGPGLVNGELHVPGATLAAANGFPIRFYLHNSSPDKNRKYSLTYYLTLKSGPTSGWSPLDTSPQTDNYTIPYQVSMSLFVRIYGPNDPGREGTIFITATLTEEDGIPVSGGETQSEEIDFIVI